MSEFEVEPVRRSMIDPEKMAAIETAMRGDVMSLPSLPSMSEAELRKLRDEIDGRLPQRNLDTIDLEQELVDQYYKTKTLMDEVVSDEEIPANQKSQVCGAVISALGQLVKMQEDLKRQNTLKIMESCLIDAIKLLPDAVKDAFYVEYERLAKKEGLL